MDDDKHKGGAELPPKIKREYLYSALGFTCAVPLYALFLQSRFAEGKAVWLGYAGMFMFSIMAIVAWVTYFKRLSAQQSDDLIMRVMGWIVATPFIVALIVILAFGVFSFFGWLGSIPAWAAVIIILLIILLVKK